MKICNHCNIYTLDDTDHCPFCYSVVESKDDAENEGIITDSLGGYPNAIAHNKKLRFAGNLVLFISIIVVAISAYINLVFTPEYRWYLIVGLGLLYVNAILQFAIIGQNGYSIKAWLLAILGVLVAGGIDASIGYRGWSVNFFFPSVIIFLNIGILVLMIVNHRNWQSYMMSQILMVIFSLFGLLLYKLGVVTVSYIVELALFTSSALLLGTFIIGDRRARNELKRRFHI